MIKLLQSMEKYIQIPTMFNSNTDKCRLRMLYVYALIRNEIKDSSLTAIIPQEKLSIMSGVSTTTINNYIDRLRQEGYIENTIKVPVKEGYYYNKYKMPYLKEYGIIKPDLLESDLIEAVDKGLLILIKLNCQYGTNVLEYTSINSLAKQLKVSRNTLKDTLQKLCDKGFLGLHNGWLNLSQKYFPLYVKPKDINIAYKGIYDYCIINDCIPPYKDYNDKSGTDSMLKMIFDCCQGYKGLEGYEAVLAKLKDRCKNLPYKINFAYLKKALLNVDTQPKQELKPIIL